MLMFKPIRRYLLISYLGVFTMLLGAFAIAIRIAFARSLSHQLIDKLTALGQGAAVSIEIDHGTMNIENDSPPQALIQHQGLQWFNLQGQEVARQGQSIMTVPFSSKQMVQLQKGQPNIQGVTIPVWDGDSGGQLVGYVRASQSLIELDDTLHRLDMGLGGGIIVSLLLSSLGGIWLTRQAMQPIEQSFSRLQQFTADASHELRSPLMVVKSNAAVALKYPEGMRESDAEKFAAIVHATRQMTQLTEDLLSLARADRLPGQDWERIDVSDLLNNLIKPYLTQTVSQSIHFTAKISPSLYMMGDAMQLIRLITNLIDNAFHYTSPTGTIELEAIPHGSFLEIRIKDTGVGIAPEHLDHVFDRFWRADQARSYWQGGSGLGLAIAQSIAKLHGGHISVTSCLNQGSQFTVRLPAIR